MSKLLLTIRYDGTRFHGWQVQPNGITVQETLQDAVEQITGIRSDLTGCSRTDAGVHARRFYCTTALPQKQTPEAFCKALNAVLPPDVAVLSARCVSDEFHPRYSAMGKRYCYRIWNGAVRDPFERPYSLHIRTPLDERHMNETAQLFLGTHDFSAFCSAGGSVQDKVRTITRSEVTRQGDVVAYTVEANGFLYNMVRILVGTLLDVEYGKLTVADIRRALQEGDRQAAGITVSPQGLFLDDVWYSEDAL
ncbi:MAG: tRNA pseudouridine(38-40) synthase TruA [Clostridia bacterium]|nr:tRNA pseudouridine(38-40) synthase TruA [Clostridia bacterium]